VINIVTLHHVTLHHIYIETDDLTDGKLHVVNQKACLRIRVNRSDRAKPDSLCHIWSKAGPIN